LFVELTGKLREVAREVPLDVKGLGGLLFLEGCDNAPLISEMLDNCLDCLATVTHVVFFEFLDVCGIDGLAYSFVNDECVDGFLLPKLLASEVVQARDQRSM
jgi:hypothetical protein